jgi:hypothetical protein
MPDLNAGSFFRKGGVLTPLGPGRVHTQVGRNLDGSWYIDLNGAGGQIRSVMTPLQMFEMCAGALRHMGYALDFKPPDDKPIVGMGAHELAHFAERC